MSATGKRTVNGVLLNYLIFLLIGFFVVACLGCGGSSGGDDDDPAPTPSPYGSDISLSGQTGYPLNSSSYNM